MGDDNPVLICELIEEICFSVEELAAACHVSVGWVEQRVSEGQLSVAVGAPPGRPFTGNDLKRAQRLYAIERDFDAVPELAALVADLLEEVEVLRARLARTNRGMG